MKIKKKYLSISLLSILLSTISPAVLSASSGTTQSSTTTSISTSEKPIISTEDSSSEITAESSSEITEASSSEKIEITETSSESPEIEFSDDKTTSETDTEIKIPDHLKNDPYFPASPTAKDIEADAILPGEVSFVDGISSRSKSNSLINREIIQNIENGTYKRPAIQKAWRTYSEFSYATPDGMPLGIVVHETANPTSTILGEISYMDSNWQNAFVHAFVDQSQIIEIHNPALGAWGAGRVANKYFMHVELCEHINNREAFKKSLFNDAHYIATKLQQFSLKPSRPSGKANDTSGTVWSHAEVSSYLGGTDHGDPVAYFAKFGYSMADFYELISYEYKKLDTTPPTIDSAVVKNIDSSKKKFEVVVKSSAKSGIDKISVPAWTGDGSDLHWFSATKQSDGSYKAIIDANLLKNSTGAISMHVYSTSNVGLQTAVALQNLTLDFKAPQINSATIENIDNINGTFDVYANITPSSSGLRESKLQVSTKNDSKIVTYSTTKQSDGRYKATIDYQKHNYSNGPYKVQVIATSNQSIQSSKTLEEITLNLPELETNFTITDTKNDNSEYLLAAELKNFPAITGVKFPVWSDSNPQKTLKWYSAKYNASTNKWETKVPISDYKLLGKYSAHCYVTLANGSVKTYQTSGFTVQDIQITGQMVPSSSISGKATITIDVDTKSTISEVRVPIWSIQGGADLKWYSASKIADGKYQVDFDYKNHQFNFGNYTAHVYVTTTSGIQKSISLGQMAIKEPTLNISTDIVDLDNKNETFLLTADVNNYPVKSVKFPVWSDTNPQKTLKWYPATLNAKTNKWEAKVPISSYKVSGSYSAHCYVTLSNGKLKTFKTSGFSVDKVQISGEMTPLDTNQGQATITVNISSKSSITEVKILVWSIEGGADLKWYSAKKIAEGQYQITFDYKNHMYNSGKFKAHAYVTTANKIQTVSALGEMQIKKPTLEVSTNIIDVNNKNEKFLLTATTNNYPVKSVSFPVWSDSNSKKTLKWYPAKYNASANRWEASVPISDYKLSGNYSAHCYVTLANNTQKAFQTSGFSVNKVTISGATQVSAGKATITINIAANSTINEVKVPIWSIAGGADLKWYSAKKLTSGQYQVSFNYANHKYNTGLFTAHVYVSTANGIQTTAALKQFNIQLVAGQGAEVNFFNSLVSNVMTTTNTYGLYPSVMMAQAALESAYGTSELAKNANNLFGIKGSYLNNFYEKKTLEYIDGKYVEIIAKFRKYPTKDTSIVDNALKLTLGPNTNYGDPSWNSLYYAGTWRANAKTYQDATKALCGTYATDPSYNTKLNSIIQKYNLFVLD